MIRVCFIFLIWTITGCGNRDSGVTQKSAIIRGYWKYIAENGSSGVSLSLDGNAFYSQKEWSGDLEHREFGYYEVQRTHYSKDECVLMFYPSPDSAYGSLWYRNPYGCRIMEVEDSTLVLMISSSVKPFSGISPIKEDLQLYRKTATEPTLPPVKS